MATRSKRDREQTKIDKKAQKQEKAEEKRQDILYPRRSKPAEPHAALPSSSEQKRPLAPPNMMIDR